MQERAHLQEWVIAHPEILGDDLLVVTAEYDRWEGAGGALARDRLDVLALAPTGRLVVAELKREEDRRIQRSHMPRWSAPSLRTVWRRSIATS